MKKPRSGGLMNIQSADNAESADGLMYCRYLVIGLELLHGYLQYS